MEEELHKETSCVLYAETLLTLEENVLVRTKRTSGVQERVITIEEAIEVLKQNGARILVVEFDGRSHFDAYVRESTRYNASATEFVNAIRSQIMEAEELEFKMSQEKKQKKRKK